MVNAPIDFLLPHIPCMDPPIPGSCDDGKRKESQCVTYCPRDMLERRIAHESKRIPRHWSYDLPTRCECFDKSTMGFISEGLPWCRNVDFDRICSISIRFAFAMILWELSSVV